MIVKHTKNMKFDLKFSNRFRKMPAALKASAIYTSASFLTKGLQFITIPIFTRIMSTAEIGIVTTFTSWQTIISVFATLSLNTGAFNVAMLEYQDKRDDYESSILTLSTLSSSILLLFYLLTSKIWISVLGLSSNLLILMLIGFIFTPAMDYWLARQRYEYEYKKTAVTTLSLAFISTSISVVAVILASKAGNNDLGTVRIFTMCSVSIAFALPFYISIMRHGHIFFSKEYWKYAITINLPLMFHALAKHILDVSDRVMISSMVGESAVGIYGTLYSISSLSLIIWTAINASLVPYMFEKLRTQDTEKMNEIVFSLLRVYAVFAFCITLMAPEIVRILATEEYYSAIYMMPPVAAGIFLTSLYNVFANVLLYYKKTVYIMFATLGAALINIGLNWWFIPIYGYIAASYTTLVAYIFLAVFQYVALRYVHKETQFPSRHLLLISITTILLILGCNLLYEHAVIRYGVILAIGTFAVIFRKRILLLVKHVKSKA